MKKNYSKPHLSIDCRKINDSGIGTYLKNILPGIIASGKFRISVLGFKEEIKKFNWFPEVTFINLKSKPLSLFEHIELPLKIPDCDIYWSPNINGSIFPTRAKARATTIHDVYHLAHARLFSKAKLAFLKTLIKSAIFYSRSIITVSEFSKRELVKYTKCPGNKIVVTSLAVDSDFNHGFIFSKISEPYILFVGNVKPHKNLFKALEAFKKLGIKGLKFYIIGKRDGFITGVHNLDSLIADLGDRVKFIGFVNDTQLKNYYANAKAFIFPSKYEGFGLPVLEAMKFNIPVVASNVASIPEVGGNAIAYFDPDNVDDIIQQLKVVLDPDFKVNISAYENQINKFDWNKTVQQHVQLFLSISNKKYLA